MAKVDIIRVIIEQQEVCVFDHSEITVQTEIFIVFIVFYRYRPFIETGFTDGFPTAVLGKQNGLSRGRKRIVFSIGHVSVAAADDGHIKALGTLFKIKRRLQSVGFPTAAAVEQFKRFVISVFK